METVKVEVIIKSGVKWDRYNRRPWNRRHARKYFEKLHCKKNGSSKMKKFLSTYDIPIKSKYINDFNIYLTTTYSREPK